MAAGARRGAVGERGAVRAAGQLAMLQVDGRTVWLEKNCVVQACSTISRSRDDEIKRRKRSRSLKVFQRRRLESPSPGAAAEGGEPAQASQQTMQTLDVKAQKKRKSVKIKEPSRVSAATSWLKLPLRRTESTPVVKEPLRRTGSAPPVPQRDQVVEAAPAPTRDTPRRDGAEKKEKTPAPKQPLKRQETTPAKEAARRLDAALLSREPLRRTETTPARDATKRADPSPGKKPRKRQDAVPTKEPLRRLASPLSRDSSEGAAGTSSKDSLKRPDITATKDPLKRLQMTLLSEPLNRLGTLQKKPLTRSDTGAVESTRERVGGTASGPVTAKEPLRRSQTTAVPAKQPLSQSETPQRSLLRRVGLSADRPAGSSKQSPLEPTSGAKPVPAARQQPPSIDSRPQQPLPPEAFQKTTQAAAASSVKDTSPAEPVRKPTPTPPASTTPTPSSSARRAETDSDASRRRSARRPSESPHDFVRQLEQGSASPATSASASSPASQHEPARRLESSPAAAAGPERKSKRAALRNTLSMAASPLRDRSKVKRSPSPEVLPLGTPVEEQPPTAPESGEVSSPPGQAGHHYMGYPTRI